MNDDLTRAKSIDIEYFLSKNGIKPKRESQSRSYYLSPFREETQPSFIVYKDENRWRDWGNKEFGDVIDLAERIWGCKTSEAIIKLLNNDDIPKFHKRDTVIERMPGIEVVGEKDGITNEALCNYMENMRKIPISVLNSFCSEVRFKFQNRRYITHIAVGMKNDLEGWALRNTWFRGAVSPAGIRTICQKDTDEVIVVEGFLDYASYLVLYGEPEHTTIILNSLIFFPMILDFLQGMSKVHIWVDNDAPADGYVDELYENGVNVIDHRSELKEFNDINDFLCANL